MDITNKMFEDNGSDEITYMIDRLNEKYDHEILPVQTPTFTPTFTPTSTETPTFTPTFTETPTFTKTLDVLTVGFDEYSSGHVKMTLLIPDDKKISGFAFEHSDAEYYTISMAPESTTPETFMYEPTTINENIKRCAFITSNVVSNKVDIVFTYTATAKQEKFTQEYNGPKIKGLHIQNFIAYDENRQEVVYEIRDALVENSNLGNQGGEQM